MYPGKLSHIRTSSNILRLAIIHKVLLFGNLFWLIFSALTVELTLNFNHANLVLGGQSLSLPSQLLPFLVGLFGFIRTSYVFVQKKWINISPAETLPTSRNVGSDVLRADPAPGGRRRFGPRVLSNISELGRRQQRSWPIRYLVAWLPWLSLLDHVDKELSVHAISRQGTGLDGVSRPEPTA